MYYDRLYDFYGNICKYKMFDVEIKSKLRILLKLCIEVRPFFLQTGIFSQNRLQTELLFSIMRYENHPKKGDRAREKMCIFYRASPCIWNRFATDAT